MVGVGPLPGSSSESLSHALAVVLNPWFIAGMACYVVSIGVWLIVLSSKLEVSVAYPLLSIGYIITAVVGFFFLGENVTLLRVFGIALICSGLLFITRTAQIYACVTSLPGAPGLPGRYLASFLLAARRRGRPVRPATSGLRATARPSFRGDATVAGDLDRLDLSPGDVVYHLAARQFADAVPRLNRTAWFEAVNVEGTREVLAAMARGRREQARFFLHRHDLRRPPVDARDPVASQRPLGPYGASKMHAEALIRSAGEGGIAATIVPAAPHHRTRPGP